SELTVPLVGGGATGTGWAAAWAASAAKTKMSAVADDNKVRRYCRPRLLVIDPPIECACCTGRGRCRMTNLSQFSRSEPARYCCCRDKSVTVTLGNDLRHPTIRRRPAVRRVAVDSAGPLP